MAACLLASGSALAKAQSKRMRYVPHAEAPVDPANATVVFLKPSNRIAASAIIDGTGIALGEVSDESKMVIKVPPGPHVFIKAMYKGAEGGNYSLFGHLLCNQLSGTFEAGKIYFVEVSMFRLFTVKPGDKKLPAWAALQRSELAVPGPVSAQGDPEWKACVAQAAENAAKEQGKKDTRSTVTPADAFTAWPH